MRTKILFSIALLCSLVIAGEGAAQWKQGMGPAGAEVTSLAVCNGHFFAATPDGIFRSTDDGDSWSDLHSGFSNVISVVALGSELFVATSDPTFRGTPAGIFV